MNLKPTIFCILSAVLFGCASRSASTASTKTHTLPSWGNGAPRLQIDVPASFNTTRSRGPDFDAFYFTDAGTKSSIGLYVGSFPSLRSKNHRAGMTLNRPGLIRGKQVEWLRWTYEDHYWSETVVSGLFNQSTNQQYPRLVLHIFAVAAKEQEIDRLLTVASTIRLAE